MPPKKTVPTGMVEIEEHRNVIFSGKPSSRKSTAKTKKPSPHAREIVKVKMVSPILIAKNKEARKKLAKGTKNGVVKRKAPSLPKPLKIKKMLSTQEKIAFANQVAQAQLVKGASILGEPVVPVGPPPTEQPAVKPVRQKIGTRQWKKKTAPTKTDVSSPVALSPKNASPTSGVIKKKTVPRKRLLRRKQAQPKLAHDEEADVAVTGLLIDNPTPVKKRRRRPKNVQIECSIENVPLSQRTLGKRLFNSLEKSTDNLSETTREDARKIEDNLNRPESKVSDTFSWAADISSSSRSTNYACVCIHGKLPTVKVVDCRKYPDASAKRSLTSLSSRSDGMSSPKKRKISRSPPKDTRFVPPPKTLSKRQRDKTHLENDKGHVENKRPSKERGRSEKTDEVNTKRKMKTQSKDRKVEEKNKILELEREKRRIESLLVKYHKWNPTQLASHNSQEKKLEESAKPVHSSGRSEASSTFTEGNPKSRPRSSSQRRLRSGNGKPKEPKTLLTEVPLSTPVESPSTSLNLTSSTSITMSEPTSATPTHNECKRENIITKVLDRLQQTLNNIDKEFIEWLSKEDDHQTDKPIPNITFNVLKLEVEAIQICRKFKRGIPDLSNSEKSVDSCVGSMDMQPSDEPDKPESEGGAVQETVTEPGAPTVDDLWPYVYESKRNNELQTDYCDDGDDVISLLAESISCFDSIKNPVSSWRVPSPAEELWEPTAPVKPVITDKETAPVVKFKTADVQKQNADSSTYYNTRTRLDSYKPKNTPKVTETPKRLESESLPLLMADIYKHSTPSHLGSAVFQGYCFFNLISKCKKNACTWLHEIPEQILVKNKLAHLSEQFFISEYLLLRRNPPLRSRFIHLYVDECLKRDLTRFLVEMASDAVREQATTKTYIMETTLLHLNDKDLETCKDILTNPLPGLTLCDEFMETIGDTQNFSRFKPVFVKLTNFLEQRRRKIAPRVATQIFERICILPYEEALAQAAIFLVKNTPQTVFDISHMSKFLERLAENNAVIYKDLVQYLSYQDDGTQPNVENVRHTSPDSTHLDRLQSKPPDDTATTTRAVDLGLTRTITQRPAPPPLPGDCFEKHAFPRPREVQPRGAVMWRDNSFRATPRFRGNPRMGRGDHNKGFRRPDPKLYCWTQSSE